MTSLQTYQPLTTQNSPENTVISKFNTTYDGILAAKFAHIGDAQVLGIKLSKLKMSHKIKITKSKKHGIEYVVMLLSEKHQELPHGI